MVSKASATKGSSKAIDYIQNDKEKGMAVELDRNLLAGENGKEILSEFREVQSQNRNCVNNTYSIVLSPSNEREFSNKELRDFGRDHLKNLDLSEHQYLMTVHRSTDQPHVHMIVNRIDLEGKAHNDQFISKKSQESAEKIAKENGLTTAKEVRLEKEEKLKPIKSEIYQHHQKAKSNAITFEDYIKNMKKQGVEVKPTYNTKKELQGYRLSYKGHDLKASEVHRKAGVKDLLENKVKFQQKLSKPLDNLKQQRATTKQIKTNKIGRSLSR